MMKLALLLGLDGFVQMLNAVPTDANMMKMPPRAALQTILPRNDVFNRPVDRVFTKVAESRDYCIFEEQPT